MAFDITRTAIPSHPGVYLMKDGCDKIIYIGKAKNLKNRVRSYFVKNQNYKTEKLVQKISDIEFVLTDTENEAFLLESNLIKRYRPMYNIELKDQQRYTYLRVTDEKYPRLLVTRRMRTGKFVGTGRIYGPFVRGSSKLLTVGMLRKSFKIRICKTLPKKACLEYHLGNCEAPCEFAGAQESYPKNVSELESILKGKQKMRDYIAKLKGEMSRASDSLEFERAMEIRDTLNRLGGLHGEQKMEYIRDAPDEDYFGVRTENQTALVMSLKQTNGVIRDRERFSFDLVADNTFSNFLYQYYTTQKIPRFVIVSQAPDKKAVLEKMLAKSAGHAVSIVVPARGKRKKLMDLVLKNIDLIQSGGAEPALTGLQELLGLGAVPRIMECFDVSNHGSDYAVGAMSRFVDGAPDRGGYRRFKIRTVRGRDDYAMMSEIIRRRYLRLLDERSQMPDLVVVDGGAGHLECALQSLRGISLSLMCVSLAKKNEQVFVPGRKDPLVISRRDPSLQIIQHMRDEAHRFGVAYNRKLRKI